MHLIDRRDWSSDVCSSDLRDPGSAGGANPDGGGTDANNPLSAEAQAGIVMGQSHLDPFDMGVFGTIPRGDVITIRQRADELSISDGLTDRSFTPGTRVSCQSRKASPISTPDGNRTPTSSM
jgi:hypothetical protein